ncbi:MAG: hypothetical protein ACM3JH_11435 [Acidithiobacillales bacterium]
MSDDARRVLELLASGKVTVDEADQLLRAIGAAPAVATDGVSPSAEKPGSRFLRMSVLKAGGGGSPGKQVNIRVPLSLVRGGMRLGAMLPGYGEAISERLRQLGIDLDPSRLATGDLEAALKEMGELTVDVDQGRETVRITCE